MSHESNLLCAILAVPWTLCAFYLWRLGGPVGWHWRWNYVAYVCTALLTVGALR